ncbi:MAG: PqiC family protein [Pseudomonadota bacterium]|nr:PqiC family protein [Pseudomonadota bacterium]
MKSLPLLVCIALVSGCAARQRDHFYVLDAQPAGGNDSRTQFDRQIVLRVSVPSLVDRGEMVLTTTGGVTVLDHERWAAPLADLVTATLGQDIERRRGDVVVLPRGQDQTGIPLVKIGVEIDQVTARLGDQVAIATHWRVTDTRTGKVSIGRDAFASTQRPQSYTDVAAALSSCIGLLAERLVREIPAP